MPTIKKPNQHFDATLYTGTGSTQSITNAGAFKPDLVWTKSRNAAYNNKLWDSVRGVTKTLDSNATDAESTVSNGLTAFNSNGMTLGGDAGTNTSSTTYVGWQWQAGSGTTTVNTSGSISSNVSVNTTAGFSIVTYTGTGANGTVGHGLGVAPKMIILKGRSTTFDWMVYHTSLGNTNYLRLNQTNASAASISAFNNTSPTSTVFSLGDGSLGNQASATQVAYCWAEIAGFSRFGSYTGNGSADGPFIATNFAPKYVMIKQTNTTGDWQIFDTSRSPTNVASNTLYANGSFAEDSNVTNRSVDFLSNGFKIRSSGTFINASGGTFIYMAFAEAPFKYSSAR